MHFQGLVENAFRQEYWDRVLHSPGLIALKNAANEIDSGISQLEIEHKDRIDKNKDHPVVRRIAEFLGDDSLAALVELAMDVKKHPEKGTFEERQDELANDCPDLEIWNEAKADVTLAEKLLNDLELELGLLAYMRAQAAFDKAAHRFIRYENTVMKGAGIAVKWLERAKTAGKIAAGTLAGGTSSPGRSSRAATRSSRRAPSRPPSSPTGSARAWTGARSPRVPPRRARWRSSAA